MAKLKWDDIGERLYETGVKKAVLYPMGSNGNYTTGVAWNGLTKVSESPSGAEPTALYANDKKYLDLISKEEFGATIEAYTYPDAWEACDGSASLADGVFITQQNRTGFGLSYVTTVGNDTEGIEYGYKIHLVYNAKAKPASKEHSTIGENVEASTMSWELSTTAVDVDGHNPTAHIIIDSKKVDEDLLSSIEDLLYGTEDGNPTLPTPSAILELIEGLGE